MTKRATALIALTTAIAAAKPALAQQSDTSRASAEGAAAVSMFSSWSQPAVILDGTATIRLGGGSVALVRPWVMKNNDGTWTSEWYQLQVRYEPKTRVPLRIDAGVMPSPLGLATLEFRPDLNPTVSPPFYYFIPLPRFDTTFDGVQMMSSGYPLGAIVSTSGARWDARGGVTSASPSLARAELKSGEPQGMAQVVFGGGVTPKAGLRIGGGFAHGGYRASRTLSIAVDSGYTSAGVAAPPPLTIAAADATVTNIETEYAFGHTRLKGEWIWDRFETTARPATATAFFAQGVHTFTPRWFGVGRVTSVNAPPAPGQFTRRRASVVEAIAGYRLTRTLTLRGGYYTNRYYSARAWDREVCASLVWSGRWN